jgi:hypothetical protein
MISVAALLAIFVGTCVLAGWLLDMEAFKRLHSGSL